MRLFHSATIFCCYICTCICCSKLHQADYQVGEGFFTSILVGGTQLQCIYYLCRILISRPPMVFRRFKRRSCLYLAAFLMLAVPLIIKMLKCFSKYAGFICYSLTLVVMIVSKLHFSICFLSNWKGSGLLLVSGWISHYNCLHQQSCGVYVLQTMLELHVIVNHQKAAPCNRSFINVEEVQHPNFTNVRTNRKYTCNWYVHS